jgi:protein SCO1
MRALRTAGFLAAASCVAALAASGSLRAQDRTEPTPKILETVGVTEHLNGAIPLDAEFTDEAGNTVALGSYFAPGRPVILTLNYYRCPMLCSYELNGLVDGMKPLAWSLGDQFEVVTVSIDPRETPTLAAAKKQTYLSAYDRKDAAAGWHFLTGKPAAIEALTKAVGFAYEYDNETDQYGHAAVVMVVTPEGRISRYLYGVQFDPATLKLGLLEAAKGKIGTPLERFILYCYHYDSNHGRYALAAMKVMRLGGAVAVLVLGLAISTFWIRERRRHHDEQV